MRKHCALVSLATVAMSLVAVAVGRTAATPTIRRPVVKITFSIAANTTWSYNRSCEEVSGGPDISGSGFQRLQMRTQGLKSSRLRNLTLVVKRNARGTIRGTLSRGSIYGCEGDERPAPTAACGVDPGVVHAAEVELSEHRAVVRLVYDGDLATDGEEGIACPWLGFPEYPGWAEGLRFGPFTSDPDSGTTVSDADLEDPATQSLWNWINGGAITTEGPFRMKALRDRVGAVVTVHGGDTLHSDPTHGPVRAPGLIADHTVKWTLTVRRCTGSAGLHQKPVC
jgi:hypothetical protein